MKIQGLKYPEDSISANIKDEHKENVKYLFLTVSGSNSVVYRDVLGSVEYRNPDILHGLIHSGDAIPTLAAKDDATRFVSLIKPYIGKVLLILEWKSANVHNFKWAEEWLDTVYNLTGVRPLILMPTPYINAFDWESVSKKYNLITYKEKDLKINHTGWRLGATFECETLGFGYKGIHTSINKESIMLLMKPESVPMNKKFNAPNTQKIQNDLKQTETE